MFRYLHHHQSKEHYSRAQLSFEQFHQTPELKEKAKELGLPQLEYDGCSDLYVKSWDDWMKFCKSPEYTAVMNRKSTDKEPPSQ